MAKVPRVLPPGRLLPFYFLAAILGLTLRVQAAEIFATITRTSPGAASGTTVTYTIDDAYISTPTWIPRHTSAEVEVHPKGSIGASWYFQAYREGGVRPGVYETPITTPVWEAPTEFNVWPPGDNSPPRKATHFEI